MPIFSDDNSVIALIHAFFNKRYPLFTKLLSYYHTKQEQGHVASSKPATFLNLCDKAELDTMTVKDTHAIVLASITNFKLFDKLLELKDPTMEDILAKIDEYKSKIYKKEAK